MKAEAEVNSRASPTSYTHSFQHLTGCSELFSTRHKKPRGCKTVQFPSTRERKKKSIKAEWKVWGKKLICLFEKLKIYKVLALGNIAGLFIVGVSSQQKLLREKAALVPLFWALSSGPALFVWFTDSLTIWHLKVNTRNVFSLIKSGGFIDFIKEFISLEFFFIPLPLL